MSKLPNLLSRVRAFDGTDETLEGDIFNELIGVDAADAKDWYGGGRSILLSADRAFLFADRVLSFSPWMEIQGCSGRPNLEQTWAVSFDGEVFCKASTLPLAILFAVIRRLLRERDPS